MGQTRQQIDYLIVEDIKWDEVANIRHRLNRQEGPIQVSLRLKDGPKMFNFSEDRTTDESQEIVLAGRSAAGQEVELHTEGFIRYFD